MALLVDHPHPGVARLLLDRPERHNALDRTLVEALHAAVEAEREHVIVLGSAAPGRFCGGADTAIDDAERAWVSDALYELYARILELPRPVLAAVDGPGADCSWRSPATCVWPRRVRGWARADRGTGSRSRRGACRRSWAAAARSTSA
jgi:Enoyl-CoA hydratase/isomerase